MQSPHNTTDKNAACNFIDISFFIRFGFFPVRELRGAIHQSPPARANLTWWNFKVTAPLGEWLSNVSMSFFFVPLLRTSSEKQWLCPFRLLSPKSTA